MSRSDTPAGVFRQDTDPNERDGDASASFGGGVRVELTLPNPARVPYPRAKSSESPRDDIFDEPLASVYARKMRARDAAETRNRRSPGGGDGRGAT